MSAMRETAIDYINALPDDTLAILLPLLKKMSSEIVYLERISFDELTFEEQQSVIQGRKEFENGECIDFDDYLRERGIETEHKHRA